VLVKKTERESAWVFPYKGEINSTRCKARPDAMPSGQCGGTIEVCTRKSDRTKEK
jgi:hypothetical protein